MDHPNIVQYRFSVNSSESSAALKAMLCCDASHKDGSFAGRYGCGEPQHLLLYQDGSSALVHATSSSEVGHLIRPPTDNTLAILNKKQAQEQAKETEAATAALCAAIKELEKKYPVSISFGSEPPGPAVRCGMEPQKQDATQEVEEPEKEGDDSKGDYDDGWEVVEGETVEDDYVIVNDFD